MDILDSQNVVILLADGIRMADMQHPANRVKIVQSVAEILIAAPPCWILKIIKYERCNIWRVWLENAIYVPKIGDGLFGLINKLQYQRKPKRHTLCESVAFEPSSVKIWRVV